MDSLPPFGRLLVPCGAARGRYAEIPPRVEYSLTPLGLTLCEPLAALREWAETHIHEVIAARERHVAQRSTREGVR